MKTKTFLVPLGIVLGAGIPMLATWALILGAVSKRWGSLAAFIWVCLHFASYWCFYRMIVEMRKENGETKL